eukprot:1293850-Pleurochrysis_carterae.AAC.1
MRVFDAALDIAERWYDDAGITDAWMYESKVGDYGLLRMKPTEHELQQGENNLIFICDIGDGPLHCTVQVSLPTST